MNADIVLHAANEALQQFCPGAAFVLQTGDWVEQTPDRLVEIRVKPGHDVPAGFEAVAVLEHATYATPASDEAVEWVAGWNAQITSAQSWPINHPSGPPSSGSPDDYRRAWEQAEEGITR